MIFEVQLMSVLTQIQSKLDLALAEIEGLKVERDRDYVPIPEVAKIFAVSDQAVRKKIACGHLDPVLDCRYDAYGRLKYIKRSALSKLQFRKKSL
jgi:hypothetical protein